MSWIIDPERDYSYEPVTDGDSCPICGTTMNLMECTEIHWMNHCPRCGHTEDRRSR